MGISVVALYRAAEAKILESAGAEIAALAAVLGEPSAGVAAE
jgi:hypothetical protein